MVHVSEAEPLCGVEVAQERVGECSLVGIQSAQVLLERLIAGLDVPEAVPDLFNGEP